MTSSPTVLYAEDDDNDVFFMERAFSQLQRRDKLHLVSSGREAVDYLAGEGAFSDRTAHPPPDLLLLDLKMPEMSGLEVLAWIRANPAFKSLPVILFTSSAQQSDVESARKLGADGYWVKPSNALHLEDTVRQLLDALQALRQDHEPVPAEGNLLYRNSERVI